MAKPDACLYLSRAAAIVRLIESGSLRPNDRLPSLRQFSRQHGVSLATALLAYRWLEDQGLVEPRAGSGFYVVGAPVPSRPARGSADATTGAAPPDAPDEDPASLLQRADGPAARLLPAARLSRIVGSMARRHPSLVTAAAPAFGDPELRHQIARRALRYGCAHSAQDIVVTAGGAKALLLALHAVASPGDAVAVESSCDPATLQLLRHLGLVPIPVRATAAGICVETLQTTLARVRLRAALFMTNCSRPLGFVMSDADKQALVEVLERRDVTLIEHDGLGDLAFDGRPSVAQAFTRTDDAILCSSFAGSLGPGLPLGWIAPGRHGARIRALARAPFAAPPALLQRAVAEYLDGSAFERHLRRLRRALKVQATELRAALGRWWPHAVCPPLPAGGCDLWVDLRMDAAGAGLHRGPDADVLGLLPGRLFAPTDAHRNWVRLGFGQPRSPQRDRALQALGARLDALAAAPGDPPPRLSC